MNVHAPAKVSPPTFSELMVCFSKRSLMSRTIWISPSASEKFAVFASLGLPGLSGFIGEFLIFNGVFGLVPWSAAVSVAGLLLTAVFLLRMLRKVFHGPLPHALETWPPLSAGERWLFAPAIALIVIPGLWPQLLLRFINADTVGLLDLLLSKP